ncbi:hypothetical protein [Nocardioides pakistanensis]
MNLDGFRQLRSSVQCDATPASSQVRRILEDGLREELLATGVCTDLAVGSSGEADRHLVALGLFGSELDEDEVAAAVTRAWGEVAFHHWQAGAFLVEDGHVEFQALSLDRPGGHYVTVHLVLQRADVPANPRPAAPVVPLQRRIVGQDRPALTLVHSA